MHNTIYIVLLMLMIDLHCLHFAKKIAINSDYINTQYRLERVKIIIETNINFVKINRFYQHLYF